MSSGACSKAEKCSSDSRSWGLSFHVAYMDAKCPCYKTVCAAVASASEAWDIAQVVLGTDSPRWGELGFALPGIRWFGVAGHVYRVEFRPAHCHASVPNTSVRCFLSGVPQPARVGGWLPLEDFALKQKIVSSLGRLGLALPGLAFRRTEKLHLWLAVLVTNWVATAPVLITELRALLQNAWDQVWGVHVAVGG